MICRRGFLIIATLIFAAGAAVALDVEITGEIKTGLFIENREAKNTATGKTETFSHTRMYNNDGDSGNEEGRIRLGLNFTGETFGLRSRFYQESFKRGTSIVDSAVHRAWVDYAYAYAHAFDEQLKISAGLLGESPWGTGGPELFRELEYTNEGAAVMGIRTEWKPSFVPGLNVGFVLNKADDSTPLDAKEQFGDLFLESILGIAWEHEYFAFRFAYRLDRGIDSPAAIVNGERFVYRVEERILKNFLPGFQIWANGYGHGINAGKGSGRGTPGYVQNWLYILYDNVNFETGMNTGYRDAFVHNAQQLEFRPFFYWKFFDNFLSVGAMAGMEIGYNNGKSFDDVFYNFWFVEPRVKVNVNSNLYAALVYRFTSGAYGTSYIKEQTTHWINLRLVYSF